LFLPAGLDDPNQVESLEQIAFCAHAFFQTVNNRATRRPQKFALICPPGNQCGIAELATETVESRSTI